MHNKTPEKALTHFLVGGAVRDRLLNWPYHECDYVVVGSNVDTMLNLGFQQVGKDFPVFLHPVTKEEYALARTEKKQGKGYTGFICYAAPDVTLEQDLLRRDLTINAIAKSSDGQLIDPYKGQEDIKNKILRHVSPAFSEDPLRVLRVARFAARYHNLGFTVADETIKLMQKISALGELKSLAAERIWKETEKALSEQHPAVYFDVLKQSDALIELFPELDAVWLNHATSDNHIAKKALISASNLTQCIDVRFAALCHAIVTNSNLKPENDNTVKTMCERLKIPNQIKSLALQVNQHFEQILNSNSLTPKAMLTLFNQLDIWRKADLFKQVLIACRAISHALAGENCDFTQEEHLLKLAELTRKVEAKPFVEQGLKGLEIKKAITAKRLEIIEQSLGSKTLD